MAIYRCQECKHEYTKKYEVCPHCGSNPMIKLGASDREAKWRRNSIVSWVFLITLTIGLIVILLVVLGMLKSRGAF